MIEQNGYIANRNTTAPKNTDIYGHNEYYM
jgi:hypothetical protein